MTVVDDAAQMFKKSGKELDIPRGIWRNFRLRLCKNYASKRFVILCCSSWLNNYFFDKKKFHLFFSVEINSVVFRFITILWYENSLEPFKTSWCNLLTKDLRIDLSSKITLRKLPMLLIPMYDYSLVLALVFDCLMKPSANQN